MDLHYYKLLDSTNDAAKAAAMDGAGHLYTVWAEKQTGGRGRMGRSFFSPEGGIYVSFLLRTGLSPLEYGALTPFSALAVADAIRRVCGVSPRVKWVNDLLLDGKKICGILAESGTDSHGVPFVIIGVGINTGDADFPPELADIAASIKCPDREALIREIAKELSAADEAVRGGTWLPRYRRLSVAIGKRVKVISSGNEAFATALDVLSDGALLVRYEDGREEALHGGEISLRSAPFNTN